MEKAGMQHLGRVGFVVVAEDQSWTQLLSPSKKKHKDRDVMRGFVVGPDVGEVVSTYGMHGAVVEAISHDNKDEESKSKRQRSGSNSIVIYFFNGYELVPEYMYDDVAKKNSLCGHCAYRSCSVNHCGGGLRREELLLNGCF
jgi:hypothetical protein